MQTLLQASPIPIDAVNTEENVILWNSSVERLFRWSEPEALALSRPRTEQAEKKRVDIHEGLDNTLLILEHRLKAKANQPAIQVIKDYGNLPLVHCYPGQLN